MSSRTSNVPRVSNQFPSGSDETLWQPSHKSRSNKQPPTSLQRQTSSSSNNNNNHYYNNVTNSSHVSLASHNRRLLLERSILSGGWIRNMRLEQTYQVPARRSTRPSTGGPECCQHPIPYQRTTLFAETAATTSGHRYLSFGSL